MWQAIYRRWHSGIERRLIWAYLIAAALTLVSFAAPLAVEAQPAGKVPRVGVLTTLPLSSWIFARQFPEALRDLGYVEKQNIILEWRSADGRLDRLADLAAELVRAKADVIVAMTNADVVAAKRATTTIPIVMGAAQDPVAAGLVASLARPGGNITGRTYLNPETVGKQLELLKETVPTITRVVYLRGVDAPGYATTYQGLRAGAQTLGLTLREVEVRKTDDVARVLEEVRRWQPDALYVGVVADLAVKHRLPLMYGVIEYTEAGALASYWPNSAEMFRRAASYVHRILTGIRPGDLPIEQPLKFELVVNLRTAKALGLTIPPWLLLRVNRLIE
ncbi:MAG: ABC transporter substrate-binding protein [Candidatus Rokubacteria bacterium]|nr:ABC transporter substrate-binding protein [Candidatus Rokubacteria bacterium]